MVASRAGDWAYTHFPKKTFLWTLHMSNPAARVLLANDKTRVEVNVLPPCAIEVRGCPLLAAHDTYDGVRARQYHSLEAVHVPFGFLGYGRQPGLRLR